MSGGWWRWMGGGSRLGSGEMVPMLKCVVSCRIRGFVQMRASLLVQRFSVLLTNDQTLFSLANNQYISSRHPSAVGNVLTTIARIPT